VDEKKPGSFDRFRWQAVQRWNGNKKFSNLNVDYVKDYIAEARGDRSRFKVLKSFLR